jgi:hypothetical protein
MCLRCGISVESATSVHYHSFSATVCIQLTCFPTTTKVISVIPIVLSLKSFSTDVCVQKLFQIAVHVLTKKIQLCSAFAFGRCNLVHKPYASLVWNFHLCSLSEILNCRYSACIFRSYRLYSSHVVLNCHLFNYAILPDCCLISSFTNYRLSRTTDCIDPSSFQTTFVTLPKSFPSVSLSSLGSSQLPSVFAASVFPACRLFLPSTALTYRLCRASVDSVLLVHSFYVVTNCHLRSALVLNPSLHSACALPTCRVCSSECAQTVLCIQLKSF